VNPAQKAAADLGRADSAIALATSGAAFHWRARMALSIGPLRMPRGCILTPEQIGMIAPERLRLLISAGAIMAVQGAAPPEREQKVACTFIPDPPADQAEKEREAFVEACKRDGLQPFEYDAKAPTPPGAYGITRPPAVEASRHDQSLGTLSRVANTGT
jgi:hypothetical protein